MDNNQDRVNQLIDKLESLLKRQEDFSREINELRVEIISLKKDAKSQTPEGVEDAIADDAIDNRSDEGFEPTINSSSLKHASSNEGYKPEAGLRIEPSGKKSNIEKFIGENLISKIGIAITVIGVGIGAKYSIEHDLISPLTRIILGYLAGIGLLGFGIKLRKPYENYSAVLVSGAMAIMYLITFISYSFYGLIPQALAFGLMVVFTAFTVVAALTYNKQVIAHIGLVGAYAVPFLLSDGTGRVSIMFTYMAIINVGILLITFNRYWRLLYYSSFGLTWLIYFLWYISKYSIDEHFALALTFLSVFFIIFYLIFIAYKLRQNKTVQIHDVALILANSFIFYGIGYAILNGHKVGMHLLGLFTLGSALVHFVVSVAIYRQKLADRNLFHLVSGLVLIFITIAIPVQLNGNWVTLLWVGEAALLFWLGRTRSIAIYEKLSYPLMLLAFISIIHDWGTLYSVYSPEDSSTRVVPLLNVNFLTSMLFVMAFGFISFFNSNKTYISAVASQKKLSKVISVLIPAILIITLYYAFRVEIATYWNQLYTDSAITVNAEGQEYPDYYWNYDLKSFKTVWIINYTLLFVSILSFINIKKIKSQQLGILNLAINGVAIATFLLLGLYAISELRETYLEQSLANYYHRGHFYLGIRYVSLFFVALTLLTCYTLNKHQFMGGRYRVVADMLLYIAVLWIFSSELINWLDIVKSAQSYKLGLSILWGVSALLLIMLGIWKKKKHLRVGAIVLFGVTLLKLFLYDISHLDTISKTVVFVSLGVLLLIISFLYNKYKSIIADDAEK